MNNKKWLLKEMAKWEAEGLIGHASALAIGEHYAAASKARDRFNWGIVVSSSIGALLVGLGIIALLAANWEFLTRPMRAAAAIFPVLACALAAFWAAGKKLRSRFFWEAVGTLWMSAVVAALLIVATTYQVSDDSPALVMAMCVLTLPVVLLTRSAIPTVAWLALPIVWFSMKCADCAPIFGAAKPDNAAEMTQAFLVFTALEAAGLVAVLRTVLAGEFSPLATFVQIGVSLALPVAAIVSATVFSMEANVGRLGEGMAFLSVILAGAAIYHLGIMVRWQGLKFAAFAMFVWLMMMIPFDDAQHDVWKCFERPFALANFSCSLVPVAIHGTAAAILALLCGKERNWTAIALPFVFLAIAFGLKENAAVIASYVLALAWCAWLFLRGIKDDALDKMNAGAIALLYFIMAKFLASDASFTAKGIILVASGAALTAANILIVRRRAKGGAK